MSLSDTDSVYGSDLAAMNALAKEYPNYSGMLSDALKISRAQLLWAICHEMARTVEDFLARRTRALFLDARESIAISREVAELMAHEMGHDNNWIEYQIMQYRELAKNYFFEEEGE